MIVLGVADGHNASAALMRDGLIVGMVQEERLTKTKNQTGFPKRAIEELVRDHLDGKFERIDHVALASLHLDPYFIALDHYANFTVHDWVTEMHQYWKPYFYGDRAKVEHYWRDRILSKTGLNRCHNHEFAFLSEMPRQDAAKRFNEIVRPGTIKRLFGCDTAVSKIVHHKCHAYYGLYGNELSPADIPDALVLTADAWGDDENWGAWISDSRGQLTRIAGGADHGIARIYKFATLILGMKPNEHEYKVMGLSAYSRHGRYVEAVEQIFREALDFVDGKFVSARPLRDSYFDVQERLEGHRFDNIAAGLQSWASKLTLGWASHWLKATGKKVLCFSGGLSMNIKLNGDLALLPAVRHLSVPASGGDETISAGACFAFAAENGQQVKPIRHVYLGANTACVDGWDECLNETALTRHDFEIMTGIGPHEAARLLARNVILARCVGRSEFGARALGNRSILANPSDPANLARINNSVKNRDFWMPFTPSIQAEHASAYLDNPKNIFSPFMTIGFKTMPETAKTIIAALHPADRSARPQMVRKQDNPEYWELIERFREMTGIAALLNTSLNLHGEPMNYSLADAVRTMSLSDLPCVLTSGDVLICKKSTVSDIKTALA